MFANAVMVVLDASNHGGKPSETRDSYRLGGFLGCALATTGPCLEAKETRTKRARHPAPWPEWDASRSKPAEAAGRVCARSEEALIEFSDSIERRADPHGAGIYNSRSGSQSGPLFHVCCSRPFPSQ